MSKWRRFEEELDKRIEFLREKANEETDERVQTARYMHIWGMKEARDLFYEIENDLNEPHMFFKKIRRISKWRT